MRRWLIILLFPFSAWANWSHIEYGAANVSSGSTKIKPGDKLELELLEETLTELVREKGEEGIFYVNDLDVEMTVRTGNALKAFAIQKGWHKLQIRALPGNFFTVELPVTDTAHMKNPSAEIFDDLQSGVELLQRLANHSRSGLQLTTSQTRLKNLPHFATHIIHAGTGNDYVDPRGDVVRKTTHRYQISRLGSLPDDKKNHGVQCPVLLQVVRSSLLDG